MNLCNAAGAGIALLVYAYLIFQLRKGEVEQNLATWISWGLLDGVSATSTFVQGGNWYLASMYVFGCLIVVCTIIRSAKFKWQTVETICFLFVLVSIATWMRSGPWYATIIATGGIVVATLPLLRDAFVNPQTIPVGVYSGFTVANALGIFGGVAWTVEERFYPSVNTALCVLIVACSFRKYILSEKPRGAQ